MATSRQQALRCARIAESKKAKEIVILDMREETYFTDFFVVCSTQSERQAQAIADEIFYQFKKEGVKRLGIEGYTTGQWILEDFGSVVIHIFREDVRGFYELEQLWTEAPRIPFKPKATKKRKAAK